MRYPTPAMIAGTGIIKNKLKIAHGCRRIKIKMIPLTAPDAPILEKPGLFLCWIIVGMLARIILSRYKATKTILPHGSPNKEIMYDSM